MPSGEHRLIQLRDHLAGGRTAQAQALARRLLAENPADPDGNDAMRQVMASQGQHVQALFYGRRAAQSAPSRPEIVGELGRLLSLVGEHQEAVAMLGRARDLVPENPQAYVYLAEALLAAGRFAAAEQVARQGLQHGPGDQRLVRRLASAVLEQGRADEAVALFASAQLANQFDDDIAAAQAAIISYVWPCDPARVFAAARNYGRLLSLSDTQRPFVHAARVPAGPMKVGFLSSDLCTHSVSFFLEPLLDSLNTSRVRPIVYSTGWREDGTTQRLRAITQRLGGLWRRVPHLPASDLAAAIFADKLDVLVELNGLSTNHRQAALRLHPAPVQVTYLGYPATTGNPGIDARFVDSITDPSAEDISGGALGPGHADPQSWHTERLVRLDPCFLCYRVPAVAPEVAPSPCGPDGPVTFASFNVLTKVNNAVVALWARVLKAVPGSRLLLKAVALGDADVASRLRARFADAGVDPSRVESLNWTPAYRDHLGLYARVDVALDTFPYAGTTTTCEAMAMGVPVVSLAPPGAMHACRVGASLLRAAGLPEFIAETEDQFVSIAASLAGDRGRLAALRSTLRPMLASSPLCDAPALATRFTDALADLVRARAVQIPGPGRPVAAPQVGVSIARHGIPGADQHPD